MNLQTKTIFALAAVFMMLAASLDAWAKIRPALVKPYRVKLADTVETRLKQAASLSRRSQFVLSKDTKFKVINFTDINNFLIPNAAAVKKSLATHGYYQSDALAQRYEKHLKNFFETKKELEIFLRYQELEPRMLDMREIAYYTEIVDNMEDALLGMERILGSLSPAVHYGKVWLNEVRRVINPNLDRFTYVPDEKFLEQDLMSGRVFDKDEFVLRGKDGLSVIFKDWTQDETLEAKKLVQDFPPMTVAVLNDDPEIIEWVQIAAARGFMGPNTRVKAFDSMDVLLDWLKEGVKYDLILLDYVLEDGVSLYVANQVRAMGDEDTVLFVNSALMEDEVPSEELFNQGIDGFVSSVGFRRTNAGPRLAHALHNYFFYKNKHGWRR